MKDSEGSPGPDHETHPHAASMASPPQGPGAMFDATVLPVGPETPVEAELVGDSQGSAGHSNAAGDAADPPHRRRVLLPILLFVATCGSTFAAGAFWVGGAGWEPTGDLRAAVIRHWDQGLIYMVCVVAILLCHEMGHFLATVRYRIPASLPYFLPLPLTPLGTLGAVIGMDGKQANRKEIFDIGIAGPLAGLAVAVPVLVVGILTMDFSRPVGGAFAIDVPVFAQWLFAVLQPGHYQAGFSLSAAQLNPYFMAGWVGMLVTGLNMMPLSQLDGGHVLYTLFGRRAHVIARMLVFVLIIYVVFWEAGIWALMLVLVILMGIDHPPTANDDVSLGWFRSLLGYASLAIPLLCLPPKGIWFL